MFSEAGSFGHCGIHPVFGWKVAKQSAFIL
jgi:hypothetical protein